MKPADLYVVLNPAASRFPPEITFTAVEKACAERGRVVEFFDFRDSDISRVDVAREVGRALRMGCRRVLAVGGDGTVGMVADAFLRNGSSIEGAELGIVPAGTANVLARELGIPLELEAAIAVALDSEQTLDLDAILVERHVVLTQIGIGPDAKMIRHTPRSHQARWGRLAYVMSFLRRASRHASQRFHLTVDGTDLSVRAWQLVVANAGSMGAPPFTWGPRIDPTDGTLDLCVYEVGTVWDTARLAWRLLTGRHRRGSPTRFFRVREGLTIESGRPLLVQGDGELIARTPIHLRPRHHALRVVVAKAPEAVAASTKSEAPIASEVKQMVAATHSRTWVLQGVLRHPFAALEAVDAALFLRANRLGLGPVTDWALLWLSRVMHYGEGWVLLALVIIFLDFHTGIRLALGALPVLWITMLTVNYPLKRLFRRKRPFLAFVKARVLGPKPGDFSLPSGHAAAGFAGAFLFGGHAPGGSALFYAVAALVGFSRIYFGVHYPSDVLVGAAAGVVLAAIYRSLVHLFLPGWF